MRTLWKLAGVTLICREVLQLWQAKRIALMDVLGSTGQWLTHRWAYVGLVTGSARSPRSPRSGPHIANLKPSCRWISTQRLEKLRLWGVAV